MNKEIKFFDLNIGEKILGNWSVANAIREIISNALDENKISKTQMPKVYKKDN